MSWRETIAARSEGGVPLMGSFRGARFIVPDSEGVFGRRVEVHEYPLRDVPWVEDLGQAARRFEIEAFVDGRLPGGYLAARDALIAALEEPGAGTLAHPWHGTMRVTLAEPGRVRESTRDGGRASFRLTFVESGEPRFPESAKDTAVEAAGRAGLPPQPAPDGKTFLPGTGKGALAAGMEDFARVFNVEGLPAWSLVGLSRDLYTTLDALEKLAGGVTAPIALLIRTPANMAAGIVGSIRRLADIAGEPGRAVALYRRLFNAGDCCPSSPATTGSRKRQARSSDAVRRLTRQAAVIEAARSAGRIDYETRDEALSMAADLQEALDTQAAAVDPVTGAPVSDEVYQALAQLRAAVAVDLRTRCARLPELAGYTPAATLPALVIAHRLYGDPARAGEIVGRNRIRHPGFVPGGQPLEVLNA